VDLSNETAGVTVALPENPMVQFGDFHFGKNQKGFNLERAMLLGWITNTYWETNFRAQQPGRVHARYRVYPHSGGFDPVSAHRAGMETAYSQPLLQHMGEPVERLIFPATGELLRLPEKMDPSQPIFTLHIKPAQTGLGLVVRLYNASDVPQQAHICSGLLTIHTAQVCDLSGKHTQDLTVVNGDLVVNLPARQVTDIRLTVEPKTFSWKCTYFETADQL
jgi:alpha-mannosidase